MARPIVSVCIPAFQAATSIGETIQSVLDQSFDDFELVVLDNACTDGTAEVVKSFDDPRIRLESNTSTLPIVENWNRVVSFATGRYVKVLPADDVLHPDCLELQVKDLESLPQVALAVCCRDFIDSRGRVMVSQRGLVGMQGERERGEVLRRVVRAGVNVIGEPASMLFRREDFVAAGGFDDSLPLVMDMELATRLMGYGSLYGRREALASFRLTSRAMTANTVSAQLSQHRRLLDRLSRDPSLHLGTWDRRRGEILTRLAGLERRVLYGWASLTGR